MAHNPYKNPYKYLHGAEERYDDYYTNFEHKEAILWKMHEMRQWDAFKIQFPRNAELLVHLFGSRAKDAFRTYNVISEIKAASLCSYFIEMEERTSRLG